MRALAIGKLDGPDGLRLVDVPEPPSTHSLAPDGAVLIDVHAAGVSFPELLQTRGEYYVQPALPFVPGSEIAGVVRAAPPASGFSVGDRVAALCVRGGFAEVAAAPDWLTLRLPDEIDFAEGGALVLNYYSAYFALKVRGNLSAGESVLVHGAAGGLGTAALQVARGLGARTIAVVSSEDKERVARAAGADEVVRSTGPWKDEAREWSGAGIDVVLDPVGGERFTDSVRALAEGGRVIVVGFTAGSIPEVKVNRLLMNNVAVIGSGWGATWSRPELNRSIGAAIDELIRTGFIKPVVGARFPLVEGSDALRLLDERLAVGKVVLDIRT
jgi:NADPH2:quinone reductase